MPRFAAFIALAFVALVATSVCGGGKGVVTGQPSPSASATLTATPALTRTPELTGTPAPTPTPTPTLAPVTTETAGGLSLAFVRDGDIWMINADGSDERRLTEWGDLPRYSESFGWAPGGDMIIAQRETIPSALDPAGDFRATVINLEGETVLEIPGAQFAYWSPKGDLLAYSAASSDWRVVDLQGREVLRLSDTSSPVWSPDESKIAYGRIVDWSCIEPCTTPVVLDLTDGSVWEVDPLSQSAGSVGPGFSPDGRWLSYGHDLFDVASHEKRSLPGFEVSWSPDNRYLNLLIDPRYDKLAIYDVAAQELVWQGDFVVPPSEFPPPVYAAWSPDGSRFLYLEQGQFAEQPRANVTHVVEVATGRAETVSDVVWPIRISPGGRYMAYVYDGAVWVMGVDGTGRTRLGEGAYPRWQPIPWP